ncbi:hypothetical protein PpBr36_06835 [Pyricularia pennisetigena]|uniref:hypothetical protein n=1 Tax=Pyricularia pennisetigena TaxID=1578925 RepID=UPI00114D8E3C|nr:hypothetical protein PpBr36_06835 [Pyricularia pennisetigena]TLS25295.1 hypothetical protein PpBr36_06835 [Pyricularia pennisetigena]
MAVVDGVMVAMPPPEGYIVDFDNPQRNSVLTSYIVGGCGIFLSTTFVIQRIYVKSVVRKNLGLDDALIVMGWVNKSRTFGQSLPEHLLSPLTRLSQPDAYHQGYMGIHMWEMPIDKFQKFAYMSGYLGSVIYTIPTMLSKIAVLLFLLEINAVQKWYRWSIFFAIFLVAGAGIGIFFASVFPCWPVQKSYDLSIPADVGSCINRPAMYQATAALGCITDVVIFCIPLPMVLKLQLSWRKKAGLFCLFFIGSATVITSVVRLILLIQILTEIDQPWSSGFVTIWILVEANLLIMCACMSTLRHFILHVRPSTFSSKRGKTDDNTNKSGDDFMQLRTIGQISSNSNTRGKQFLRLDGCDVETEVRADRLSIDSTKGGDDHSDRGILQTRTTRITYSKSPV